jgi:GTP-binding protein HflX
VLATGADTVICDGELSPAQLNALEKAVKVKVIDRTALILDIFAQHATSREGKAQVAYAQMEYMLPRLRGWGESMSRQGGGAGGSGGGVGTRGPGETKIETDRRRIRERMSKLRREIKDMKQIRDTQRSRRLHSDMASVAIVGYTNAGKSTLLNALTGAGTHVEDKMFATLDPKTRVQNLDGQGKILFVDTVGFLRDLPHGLIESFHATLEEVTVADLVIHVLDVSHPKAEDWYGTVMKVLEEIKAAQKPIILILNKADLLDEVMQSAVQRLGPQGILISAKKGEGLSEILSRIRQRFPQPVHGWFQERGCEGSEVPPV